MELYVDLRCLQDPEFAFRGIGYHASTLLKAGRHYFGDECRWVGLIDPAMPSVPKEYVHLVDELDVAPLPKASNAKQLFVQLSPMTHSALRMKQFVGKPNILTAAIVYDFIPLDMKERYLNSNRVAQEYLLNLTWLRHYDLLFPISHYSADRLMDLMEIHPSDVNITGVALRPAFEAMLANGGATTPSSMPATQAVRSPYFLFVGGSDRRKNVELVLRAHADLKMHDKPMLAIVGAKTQHCQDDILGKYHQFGGKSKHIKFYSQVSDADLAQLYRDSICSICSSEIEGFSLPVIESMACGAMVLASRIDAHCELVSNRDALFDPQDNGRLKNLMERAATQPAWRQEMAQEQFATTQRFTVDRVAYRFWQPLVQAFGRMEMPTTFIRSHTHSNSRPRIAVLSPFPPDRSGVADYTRRSLEEIGKLADVDVYCDVLEPQPTQGVQQFLPISDLPYLSDAYDRVVSIVGNSHFHTKIIDLQVKYGGPCLIHDNRLAELYNWWKGPEAFQRMAIRSLGRHVSYDEAQSWIESPGLLPSMFFDDLIPTARPLMVHSKGIASHVKKQYGIEPAYLPFCIYRDFEESKLSSVAKQEARARLSIPAKQLVVISLGIVSPNKAPHPCIEALAMARQAGFDAHLYFVGSSAGQVDYIQEFAARCKVSKAVHLCGDWVDEQTYNDFVIAADLAIQLRTHFFGGLSGAMLDCIASGLTTISNEDLAQALDSPWNVLSIGDDLSAVELHQQMLHAFEKMDLEQRLSEQRTAYLATHSFACYAQQFMQVLGLASNASSEVLRVA